MIEQNNKILKNILLVLLIFLFTGILFFTHLLKDGVVPIIFAFFTAMLLQPFISKLKASRFPAWAGILIVYLIFILIIFLFLFILIISFISLIDELPAITKILKDNIFDLINFISNNDIYRKYFYKEKLNIIIMDGISDFFLSFKNLNTYIIQPVSITLNFLKSFGLYALSLIFIIPGMDKVKDKILAAFPDENGIKINNIIINIMDQIQKYVVAKFIISFFTGFFSFFILVFFKIKFPFVWAVVIFLLNFIPYIGSIIAVSFPMLMSVIQFQDPLHFIFLTICLTIVQILIGNIIEPHIMGLGVNLSPIVIITSLFVWGYIWGIMGVILAVPLMSAINLILFNIEMLRPVSMMISSTAVREKRAHMAVKDKNKSK